MIFLFVLAAAAALAADAPKPPIDGAIQFHKGGKRLDVPAAADKADAEGISLLLEGSYDEAIAAFDRSLKLARKNPRARANRGVALSQLGKLDAALMDFETALALAPELKVALKGRIVETRVRRGQGRLAGGAVAAALDDFYAAIRADRQDPRGYAAVAVAGRKTRQDETCVSYATRAIDLGLESADAFADRAACRLALGRREEALKDLDKAILLDHGRGELYAARAQAKLALGRRSEAKRDASRALELDPGLAGKLPPALR